MKRKSRILGLSIAVAAILALVIAGTVSAAANDPCTVTQTENQGAECLCEQGSCSDCEPNNHSYSHDYSYSSPGPRGFRKGK